MRLMQLKEQQEQFKREREKAQIRKQQVRVPTSYSALMTTL
jgi:hypothetical protein